MNATSPGKNKLVWLLPFIFIALAFLVRFPLIQVRKAVLPGDETVVGIMAKNILEGHFPIYYYGQSYMGSLEAYFTALFSLFLGMNGLTVQIGGFFFYALFLLIHFFLVKKLFGVATAVFSSLLLVIAPVMFWELSVRALAGYTEALFLGALSFFLWLKVFSDRERAWLFPLGLSLGLGLWVNPIFMMYLIPFIPMTLYWHKGFKARVKWLHPVRLFLLRDFKGPRVLKILFLCVHLFLLIYVLKQFLVFFSGGWKIKFLGFDFGAPPFQWKGIKKILLLVSLEGLALGLIVQGWKAVLDFFKRSLGLISGFVCGYLPAIIYHIQGGEGYRILHASGSIPFHQFDEKFKMLYLRLIPRSTLGITLHFEKISWLGEVWGIFVLLFFIFAIGFYFFKYRNDWKSFFRLEQGIQKKEFFFCLLATGVLLITFMSSLAADRYLAPFYWVSSVMAGFLLTKIFSKSKLISIGILVLILSYYSLSDAEYVKTYSQRDDIYGLIRVLEKENVFGGITDYDNAYRISFYSHERVKFIPLEGALRIQKYKDYVSSLKRKAFIFPDSEDEARFLASRPEFIPQEIKEFKNFRIFVIDSSLKESIS